MIPGKITWAAGAAVLLAACAGKPTALDTGGVDVEAALFSTFGLETPGGEGGQVLHVTSLASDGPGSLREAVEYPGRRIVVFDVAGVIDLDLEKIVVTEPFLTIDGRAGPAPGITLIRGGMSIRTHDVIVRHLRVRPGDAGQSSGWEPDGIGVWGAGAQDVVIENCSISWAVDENVAVSSSNPPSDSPRRVTIRDCIIAEALNEASHSEGAHSRGALIRGVEIAVERCLFAHNNRRNPVFRDGATGIVVNNLIFDPGSAAAHLDGGVVSVVGNVLLHGSDTRSNLPLLKGDGAAFAEDNLAFGPSGQPITVVASEVDDLAVRPLWRSGAYAPLPASQVELHVELEAGAWPTARDTTDARIVQTLRDRTGGLIDSQDDVGGYP